MSETKDTPWTLTVFNGLSAETRFIDVVAVDGFIVMSREVQADQVPFYQRIVAAVNAQDELSALTQGLSRLEFSITDTDVLKHTLEDEDRWSREAPANSIERDRLAAALEASQRETQELINKVTLLSVRAGRTEATDQSCLKFMRERDQARLETQEAREIARQARHGLPKELREKVESWPRETDTGETR